MKETGGSQTKIFIFVLLISLSCLPAKTFALTSFADVLYGKQAVSFVDKVLPEILEEWSIAKLTLHADPFFYERTPRETVARLFFLFKKHGSLLEYKGAKGHVVMSILSSGEKNTIGQYTTEAIFENGSATIFVTIQKRKKTWEIISLQVDSSNLNTVSFSDKPDNGTNGSGQKIDIAQLSKDVEEILSYDTIHKRRNVSKVFQLANIYKAEGEDEKALRLFEKALQTHAANFKEQFNFAQLLLKNDWKQQAGEVLFFVNKYTESLSLFQKSKELLIDLGIDLPVLFEPESDFNKNVEIVLVPMGKPHQLVLAELKNALQNKMKVAVSIAEQSIAHGDFDRKLSDEFISASFTNIKESLEPLQYEMLCSEISVTDKKLLDPLHQSRFARVYFEKLGDQGKLALQQYEEQLRLLQNQGQYDINRLTKKLRILFPFDQSETIRSYVGVSSENLFRGGSNFLFGGTDGSYGVITYYNFTAEINNELSDRSRLVKRLLKQALSSVNFTFDIPRCKTPYCARAYPHSVAEHDAKSDDLCRVCKGHLEKYLTGLKDNTHVPYEYEHLGEHYIDKAEWDKAIITYNRVLESEQNNGRAYEGLGIAYHNKKQYNKAVKAYLRAITAYSDTDNEDINPGYVYQNLGIAYQNIGKHDKAATAYSKASQSISLSAPTYLFMGNQYLSQKRNREAIDAYESALEIDSESSAAHFNIGVLFEIEQPEKALYHYKRATEIQPLFVEAHIKQGELFGRSGFLDKALASLKSALILQPQNTQVLNDLGYTCYLKEMYHEAVKHYANALEIDSEYGLLHYNKSLAHYALKEFNDAIKHYDIAVGYDYPGSQKFHAALELKRQRN